MEANEAKFAKNIAAAVRRRRLRRRWSQAELAERVNVTPFSIGMIERGQRVPALGVLVQLAKALDTGLDELAGTSSEDLDSWDWAVIEAFRLVPREVRGHVLSMVRASSRASTPSSEAGVRVRRRPRAS